MRDRDFAALFIQLGVFLGVVGSAAIVALIVAGVALWFAIRRRDELTDHLAECPRQPQHEQEATDA